MQVSHEEKERAKFLSSHKVDPDPSDGTWAQKCSDCLWIAGGLGSMGVLVLCGERGLVVLKPASGNAPFEYFALLLSRALDVDTPTVHAVPRLSSPIETFLARVEDGEVNFVHPPDEDRLGGFFAREYFLVLEFVRGETVVDLVAGIARDMVLSDRGEDSDDETTEGKIEGKIDVEAVKSAVASRLCGETLESLGSIAALDMVINNFDRFPLGVWDNAGNPGNVIIDGNGGEDSTPRVVAIDHALLPVDLETHPVAWGKYADKVKLRTKEVDAWWASFSAGSGTGAGAEKNDTGAAGADADKDTDADTDKVSLSTLPPLVASVRDVLLECTGHDIGVQGAIEVARGFRATRAKFGKPETATDVADIQRKVEPLLDNSRVAVDLEIAVRFVLALMKEMRLPDDDGAE